MLSAFWQLHSSVLAPEVPEALAASRAKSGGTLAAFVLSMFNLTVALLRNQNGKRFERYAQLFQVSAVPRAVVRLNGLGFCIVSIAFRARCAVSYYIVDSAIWHLRDLTSAAWCVAIHCPQSWQALLGIKSTEYRWV